MWIVRLALRRPYTVAVMCFLVMLLGFLSIRRMAVDIFPQIDIPVVAVIWQYNGLAPEEMERRVVTQCERAISSNVNGIQRLESQSIQGVGLLRIYFQPGLDIGASIAQISATCGTILRWMPPGITAPIIVPFNASNVPVVELTARSETLTEQQVFDHATNFIRLKLFTIPGLATPAPYGGRSRMIAVDLDPAKLDALGLSPADVLNAVSSQNVITPAGLARMDTRELPVLTNSSPDQVDKLRQMPVKVVNGAPVYLGDVADVYDGFADQTNIVRINGRRAVYMAILKKSDASTLAVVDAAKEALPAIQAAAPEGLELKFDVDQSAFVRDAIRSVGREAVVASVLVSLMIFMFVGSWRSMILVCTSIPLAILFGIIGLKVSGQTLNLMTLGGLSLAIGMLVDDATVEVENINRNKAMGKPLTVAILDGARQIAVPAIVATLSICIVFFPVVLLEGPARFLFTPLAMAVVYSMLASYFLSRTLVPTLARCLLEHGEPAEASWTGRFNAWRERWFGALQGAYGKVLDQVLHHRRFTLALSAVLFAGSTGLLLVIGRDFFPPVDAGIMKLHVRAHGGLRLEETERRVAEVEQAVRELVPARELSSINTNLGVPSGPNLAYIPTDNVTSQDAENVHHPAARPPAHRRPTCAPCAAELPRRFPDCMLLFPARGPGEPGAQLRHPGPHRHPGGGPGPGGERPGGPAPPGRRRTGARGGGRAPQADPGRPRLPGGRGPLPGRPPGPEPDRVANGLLVALSGNGQLAPSFFIDPGQRGQLHGPGEVPHAPAGLAGTADVPALQPHRRRRPVPGPGVRAGRPGRAGARHAPVRVRHPAPRWRPQRIEPLHRAAGAGRDGRGGRPRPGQRGPGHPGGGSGPWGPCRPGIPAHPRASST